MGIKGVWAVPIIASILILGLVGFPQEAHAASITFTTDTTITSFTTIASGETWTVNSGVTLTINPSGTLAVNNGGTIINSGTFISDFFGILDGTIVGADQVSCGAGTTLNESTNECEADVTQAQLDAALAQRDAALADLNNLFTNNSCFPLAGTIQAVLDCITALIADLATAQADLLTAQNTITELLIILDGTVISSDFDGNLEVRPSDTLTIKSGATIDGNIVVNGGKLTIKEGSTITGNVDSKNSQGVTIQNSNINGNVEVKDGDLNILAGAVIDGNVKVEGGTCTISVDATVNGNLEGDCAP